MIKQGRHRHTGNEEARLHRRLLGSGSERLRGIHSGGATRCADHRPDARPARPIRSNSRLPRKGRRLGLLGRRPAPEWRTPTCTPVIPLCAMLRSRRRSKRHGLRFAACGVHRAMAIRKLFPAEVVATSPVNTELPELYGAESADRAVRLCRKGAGVHRRPVPSHRSG